MSNLSDHILNTIIDNDPSDNGMYTGWMISEVSKGIDINTVIESVNKAWSMSSTLPKSKIIELLLEDYKEKENCLDFN